MATNENMVIASGTPTHYVGSKAALEEQTNRSCLFYQNGFVGQVQMHAEHHGPFWLMESPMRLCSRKEKAAEYWSERRFDQARNSWYRTRRDATGENIFEYETSTEATPDIPQGIPRTLDATGNITLSYPATSSGTTEYNYASTTPTEYATTPYRYGSEVDPSAISTSSTFYGTSVTPSNTLNSSAPVYGNYAAQDSLDGMTAGFNRLVFTSYPAIPEESEAPSQPSIRAIAANPDAGPYEQLDPRYKVVETKDSKNFWKVGRVFMMVWSEPAGVAKGVSRDGTHFSTGYLNQQIFSEIRRFVVIGEGYGNAPCSPIHSYSGWATLKRNLPDVSQHTIIYTSKSCPAESSYIANDGTKVYENLNKDPIRVISEEHGEDGQLEPKSRLNYGKVYTIEHNVRVLNIGMVHEESLPTLKINCNWKRADPVEKPRHRNPQKEHRVDHHKKGGSGSGSRSGSGSGHGAGKGSDSKHRYHRNSR
ncbi:hypothetical protein B7494_g8547 [Chlorociboria aeruginascens]|nr:hypothetical protein B7494_g8547 [Chlorociboria aeruginascens]